MKKISFLFLLAVVSLTANAQWIRVWSGGESARYAIADVSTIPYTTSGSSLTIDGTKYSTAAIDSITIVNPVTITWSGTTASVDIPETAEGVTATVNGGDVVITNTCTSIEHEFILQGTSDAGSFTYNGEYKVKFHLAGVNLTSTTGAAVDIQCGKRIDLILEDGTTNTLADFAQGTQKAALNCQGHLEVSGGGTLTVEGNCNHALRSKEYLQLKKSAGTINITKAAADGIHCGEFFLMNGGTINVSGHTNDGLQMETSDDSDEPDNGIFTMNGGTIKITHTGAGSKAIRADSTIAVMNFNGGTVEVELTATASDSEGIDCDGDINISQSSDITNITITVGGEGYMDATSEKIRSTGMKSDGTITMNNGTVAINATGKYARGMRSSRLFVKGGSLTVTNSGSSSQGIKLDGPNSNTSYYQNTGGSVSCNNWKY